MDTTPARSIAQPVAEQRAQSIAHDRLPDDAWRYKRFLTTIQRHTGLDRHHAERAAMATIETLADRISKERAQELAEDLPERVKRRADLDRLEAERAAEIALETLAERLAPTLVEDLQATLAKLFREALQRGTVRVHGTPRELSLDEFVDRVAHEESVSFDDAFEHTRAVFVSSRRRCRPSSSPLCFTSCRRATARRGCNAIPTERQPRPASRRRTSRP